MKKCPNCEKIMNEVIKVDVLIDVCPSCMGIWLDKGELEKILARERGIENKQDKPENERFNNSYNSDYEEKKYRDKYEYNKNTPYKKKGGFSEIFGDLFD